MLDKQLTIGGRKKKESAETVSPTAWALNVATNCVYCYSTVGNSEA